MKSVSVLIVGGGISGLSVAAFLANQGVSSILVERHTDHARNPRMSGAAARSMELFRQIGLEDRIRALDENPVGAILRVETLAGREIESYPLGGDDNLSAISPTPHAWCDQDQLEPVVCARAEELGADVRFGAELVNFEQAVDGVWATIRDHTRGVDQVVHASYLVACDGTHSFVRKSLGISRSGPGVLTHQVGVLFRADLSGARRGRSFILCLIDALQGGGLLHWRSLGRWGLAVSYPPEKGQQPGDLTVGRSVELVREAIGLPDLPVEVLNRSTWRMEAEIAECFQSGRVFLVGDAAHVMPPTGGFGGNSCVQDAHNLAWKIATVVQGRAGNELLETYTTERRPVAELSMQDSVARARLFLSGSAATGAGQPAGQHDAASIALGYRYRSTAIITEDGRDTSEPIEDPRRPSGRPGTRGPHVILDYNGQRVSTLDLFGHGFVLLTGPEGEQWQQAARTVADQHPIVLTGYRIGPPGYNPTPDLIDVHGAWTKTYGVDNSGAVLIRPDGFIAWRHTTSHRAPVHHLRQALTRVLASRQHTAGLPGTVH